VATRKGTVKARKAQHSAHCFRINARTIPEYVAQFTKNLNLKPARYVGGYVA